MAVLKLFSLLLLVCPGFSNIAKNTDSYWEQREEILKRDFKNMIGHDIILTGIEKDVNGLLEELKLKELTEGFNTSNVLHAKNFLLAKKEIDASRIFNFIKKMPKGAILHSHDMAICPTDWIISELTYWPNLYMCYLENDRMLFKYFKTPDSSCKWFNVQEERATYADVQKFDLMLKHQLSIITDNPNRDLPTLNAAWSKFNKVFESLSGILGYDAAWKAFLEKSMESFVSDNIQYFEFRGVLFPLYDLDGTQFSNYDIVNFYQNIIANFTETNSEHFFGGRFIYAPVRAVSEETVEEYVHTAKSLKEKFPEFIAGFDLVGQEDVGRPLKDFVKPLLQLQKSNVTIKTFYHAGETNWEGTDSDENLIDAILLNASRIGHGFALGKHPYLMELVKERNIPVEICPISNQVLHLLYDLRNHPMAGLVANNFPLVISSDDPGLWGADPLSHDFYEAFFALGGAKADLRFLKQLAINSIRYSSLDQFKKDKLEILWKKEWNNFMVEILYHFDQQNEINDSDISDTVSKAEETNYIADERNLPIWYFPNYLR